MILSKPMSHRTHRELELLRTYTMNINFFINYNYNMGNDAHLELCSKLVYQKCVEGETIFEQGNLFFSLMPR
jgi:hypothetical protein